MAGGRRVRPGEHAARVPHRLPYCGQRAGRAGSDAETFIKALQRQDQLKDLDKAAHWLSRIASNTAIDFLRRQGRTQFTEIDELMDPLPHAAGAQSGSAAARSEQQNYCRRVSTG